MHHGRVVLGRCGALIGGVIQLMVVALPIGCTAQPERDATVKESRQPILIPKDLQAMVRRLGDVVELEITARQRFPDRAMPPVLVIGDKAFGRSRNPPDGRANTLIFTIPAAEFDALPDDAEVSIGHLSPSARLVSSAVPPEPSAPLTWDSAPRIRPDHVDDARRKVGKFHKAGQEISQ